MRIQVLLASAATALVLSCGASSAAPTVAGDTARNQNADNGIVLAQKGGGGGGGRGGGGGGFSGGGGGGGRAVMGGGGGARFYGGGVARASPVPEHRRGSTAGAVELASLKLALGLASPARLRGVGKVPLIGAAIGVRDGAAAAVTIPITDMDWVWASATAWATDMAGAIRTTATPTTRTRRLFIPVVAAATPATARSGSSLMTHAAALISAMTAGVIPARKLS